MIYFSSFRLKVTRRSSIWSARWRERSREYAGQDSEMNTLKSVKKSSLSWSLRKDTLRESVRIIPVISPSPEQETEWVNCVNLSSLIVYYVRVLLLYLIGKAFLDKNVFNVIDIENFGGLCQNKNLFSAKSSNNIWVDFCDFLVPFSVLYLYRLDATQIFFEGKEEKTLKRF